MMPTQDEILKMMPILTNTDKASVTKSDGSVIRAKEYIIRDYDNSWLPYPLKAFYELDYCWNITKMLLKHSFIMAVPVSFAYTVVTDTNKEFLKLWITKWPWRRLCKNYILGALIVNCIIHTQSLLTVNYCQRGSDIYKEKRSSKMLLGLIKEENNRERKTLEGQIHQELSEEEIKGQK